MKFTSDTRLDDSVRERKFLFDDIPGILWTPNPDPSSSPTFQPRAESAPLVLLGHPGGLQQMYSRLAQRARRSVLHGFAAACIELPGRGSRPKLAGIDQARAQLRQAIMAGQPVDDIVDRLVLPLVELAVPELRATLRELLRLPEIDGPVGYSGGVTAIGLRMALVEPRIAAAVLFAGSFVPRSMFDAARQVTIPMHMLLQWDDAGNDRQQALNLFDALGSPEKTLHANMGGHTGVPDFAGEEAERFLVRHLR